jgi:hypothetical protein
MEKQASERFQQFKRILFAVFLITAVATNIELLLVGHTEDLWQWTPLILIWFGIFVLLIHAVVGRKINLQIFQATMLIFILSGIVGLFLHYKAKMEFKLEMDPSLQGFDLFIKTLRGGTLPPVLAPGMMIQLGCIGFLYSYCHQSLHSAITSNMNEEL